MQLKLKDRNITEDIFRPAENGSIQDGRSEEWLLRNARYDRNRYLDGVRRDAHAKKGSFLSRLFDSVKRRVNRGTSIEDTFKGVKQAIAYPTNESVLMAQKLVDALIERNNLAGQYEIANRVQGVRKCLELELVLAQNKILRYITEDQIIRFMLASEKGVRLEYLRYYNEIVPNQVAALKMASDGLLVFDNYCVLYYDKDTSKFRLVKEAISEREREKRRDPILFGMIKGSRKLYYITDWVTDDDDLTMDKLEKVIGETALDLGEDPIAGSQETIEHLLESVEIDVATDLEIAAEKGMLITEQNLSHFVRTGEVAYSMRNVNLPKLDEMDAPDEVDQSHEAMV